MLTPLSKIFDESRYGGKAVQLGAAIRAELPVPPGFALAFDEVKHILHSGEDWSTQLNEVLNDLGNFVAVRSSAVGEDSAAASFAGQHATVLGVRTVPALLAALREVLDSAHTEAAMAYRVKLGLNLDPRMGIVVQKLIFADVAGVLFTRHPLTGADERVIEATWGLGEAVVQGLVTPDRVRMERGGRVLERSAGEKDLAIQWLESGGTEEIEVDPERASMFCLTDQMLHQLESLTSRCETVFGGTQDIEFAFEKEILYLLQRRAITRG